VTGDCREVDLVVGEGDADHWLSHAAARGAGLWNIHTSGWGKQWMAGRAGDGHRCSLGGIGEGTGSRF